MNQPLPPHPDPPRPVYSPPRAPPGDGWTPWVTYGLIAANVAAFAFELSRGAGLSGPDPGTMIALGGDFGPLTCHGQSWRLVTAMFLHYGLLHIGMNMVCLYQIRFVERMLGRAEFLAVYLAAGMVGDLASVALHPRAVGAGASGAVFGMFGAFTAVMIVRRKQIDPSAWRRTMQSLGSFFAINLAIGFALPGIDVTAHVGGLVVGFVAAYLLAKTARPGGHGVLRAMGVAVVGAGIAFGGVFLLAP